MTRRTPVVLALALAAAILAAAPAHAAINQSFQQTGNLGVEFLANGGGNTGFVNGSFNVTNVVGPSVRAYVYALDFNHLGGAPDLVFGGIPVVPTVVTTDTTLAGTFLGYRWDVTAIVNAPVNYNYSIGGTTSGSQITAVGLVAVYNDPSAPVRQVTILDGVEQVGPIAGSLDSKSYAFNNLLAGPTDVWALTGFDSFDSNAVPSMETGETVTWNGTNVGGPLDANNGLNASLTHGTANSIAGTNTLAVSTGPTPVDHFGVIAGVAMVTVVPEPTTGFMALVGVVLIARRRSAAR